MAYSKTFELQEFSKGDFITWEVITQTSCLFNVTLKSGNTVYFSAEKTDPSNELQIISQDSCFIDHDQPLILTVTAHNGEYPLKSSNTSGAITDQKARSVGYTYIICIEDYIDDDFNDVYVNITGWKKRG